MSLTRPLYLINALNCTLTLENNSDFPYFLRKCICLSLKHLMLIKTLEVDLVVSQCCITRIYERQKSIRRQNVYVCCGQDRN